MSTTDEQSYTFLFTDIEGSTRLWERHPTAVDEAIARQKGTPRDAITVRGAPLSPISDWAIAAAIDGQRQLLAESWGLRLWTEDHDAHDASRHSD